MARPGSRAEQKLPGRTASGNISTLSRPVLVLRRESRPRGLPRLAHPDLAIGMQAGPARGRNSGEPRTTQQARVGVAAIRVNTAVRRHHLVPGCLAQLEDGGVRQRRAVELVRVQIRNDLITVLNK